MPWFIYVYEEWKEAMLDKKTYEGNKTSPLIVKQEASIPLCLWSKKEEEAELIFLLFLKHEGRALNH